MNVKSYEGYVYCFNEDAETAIVIINNKRYQVDIKLLDKGNIKVEGQRFTFHEGTFKALDDPKDFKKTNIMEKIPFWQQAH